MGRRSRKRKEHQLEDDAGFGPAFVSASQERSRLTPLDVQQKVFRLAFRGYNEQDVDQFLDQVTEDLAALHEDNKRLREELELRGSPAGFEDAKRHAEETVRRAREEAAQVMADAERRVGTAEGLGGSPAPPSYLVRERDFLQELAALVQGHAERLKEEARRAREREAEAGGGELQPEPEEEQEAVPPGPEATAPLAAALGSDIEDAHNDRPEQQGPVLPEWAKPLDEQRGSERPRGERAPEQDWGGEQAQEASGPDLSSERKEDEEPSLRELFWGEE